LDELTSKSRSILSFYIVLESVEDFNIAKQILVDSFSMMRQELESINIFARKLNSEELEKVLYEKMNPLTSLTRDFKNNGVKGLTPSMAVVNKNGKVITIEDKHYRFYAINNYPASVEKYRWLRKLMLFRGEFNVAIIMTPKQKDKALRKLSRSIEDNEALADNQKSVARKQDLLDKAESARDIIRDISRDNINLYDVNITISIASNDLKKLDQLNSMLISKISSMYMKVIPLVRKGFDSFYTILPILADNWITKNVVWNLTTADVASIIPFDLSEFAEDSGVLIGENLISGGLVITDFRNNIYNNSNLAVIADSGAGKTFYLKLDALRNRPYTDYTIMFDLKGDLVFPFGCRYVFSTASKTVVNPFHIRSTILDSEFIDDSVSTIAAFLSHKVMDLIVFFKWIIQNMTAYDESILEEDIRDSYSKCGLTFDSEKLPDEFCTMETLGEIMDEKLENPKITTLERERREYIKACLKPYITGSYSRIFNGQTNWDFEKFMVIDISNTPEAVKKPLYDILLKDVWQFAKKDGTINPPKKDIYVDEAHEFADADNPQTFEFLARKLIKQGRGFGVRTITATQNLSDFLALPKWGQAILDNSYFKLFMKLGENDIPVAEKLYKFSKIEKQLLMGYSNDKKGVKGRGVLSIATQKVLIKVIASKFELEIIDPVLYERIYRGKSKYMGI
jgi:hypothetical protein